MVNSKQLLLKFYWEQHYSSYTYWCNETIVNKTYADAHGTKHSYHSEGSHGVTIWETEIQEAWTSGSSHTGGHTAIYSVLQSNYAWSTLPEQLYCEVNGVQQNITASLYSSYDSRGCGIVNIYMFKITGLNHTHNSNGVEYNQGNDNQHIKYTYCDGHGSDHSQNRNSSYENHSWTTTRDWYNYDNTTMHQDQKCSVCGRTRTNSKVRTYNIDLNINNPQGTQARNDGGYGWGYVKVSLDNTNWSDEITNETSLFASRQYGDKIYIKYTRPYYDYLEFGSISVTNNKGLVDLGNNVWCYTVSDNPISGYTGGIIDIYMDYKHTTLTIDPNGGSINGNTGAQALFPKLQYSTSEWNNLSTKKPSRTGYTFTGWYDQASGGTKVYNVDGTCVKGTKYFDSNGNSLMTSDVTLYAQWSINTYHIYYTLYGSSASVKRTYTITDNAFTLPKPSLNGYTFKGWVGGVDKKDPMRDASGKTYSTPTGNITIPKGTYGDYFFRAVFEKNHSVDADGNKTDDVYVAHSEAKEKQYQ